MYGCETWSPIQRITRKKKTATMKKKHRLRRLEIGSREYVEQRGSSKKRLEKTAK
jgi:hypothetical protein